MVETILVTASPSGGTRVAVYVIAMIAGALLVWGIRSAYTSHYRARAASGAPVVEVPRDFVVADGCPNCGDAKAYFAVKVRKRTIAGTRGDHLAAYLHPKIFRFCLRCVRPIRQRRRLAVAFLIAGSLVTGTWIAFVAGIMHSRYVEDLWRGMILEVMGGWSVLVFFAPLAVGLVLLGFGASFIDTQRGVMVVDTGGETMFVQVGSSDYRDAFARLNAVEGWSESGTGITPAGPKQDIVHLATRRDTTDF